MNLIEKLNGYNLWTTMIYVRTYSLSLGFSSL